MIEDFFDELERELTRRTREGAHLTNTAQARHVRGQRMRRALVGGVTAVVLAASLVSEFPATASGHSRSADAAHLSAL